MAKLWDRVAERSGLRDVSTGFLNSDPDLLTAGFEKLRRGPRPYLDDDPLRDKWIATNSSYSGADCTPIVQLKDKIIILGNLSTISISVFREKEPVRTLGRTYAKGYTGGPRTIAGSMTFVVFDRDPFWEIINQLDSELRSTSDRYSTPVGDQIPPVDISLWFANEYGHKSILRLYGVEFNQEGQVHSVNDIYSEKTVSYLAKDYDVMMQYKDVEGFRNLMYERMLTGQFTDNKLAGMISYMKQLEKKIHDADVMINRIYQEKGKRGLVTFGITSLVGNRDLNIELSKQQQIKQSLMDELERLQREILNYRQTFYYENHGTAQFDDLSHAPATGPGTIRS